METTARVIITQECERGCAGCCNTYNAVMSQAKSIADVSELAAFDVVCITGGEPMLDPEKTLAIIKEVRRSCSGALVYLYTSQMNAAMPAMLDAVDGMQYSLHAEALEEDVADFQRFQDAIEGRHGSFRLYVDVTVGIPLAIRPNLWRRVEIKPWMTEDQLLECGPGGLPEGESLFVLEEVNGPT